MTRTVRTNRSTWAALALIALSATACGGGDETATDASTGSSEPVVVEHAFGSTEVPADPQRVVTWGWGSADAAVALGVVPVGMAAQAYGGDDEGVLPWVREAVEEQGAELPEVLPDVQEVPVEAIAALEPDLVLAPYSGITEAEYEQLSQLAPTVAYPEAPWSTPWRETIEIVGTSLGREAEAAALLEDIDAAVAEQAQAHPELTGKTVALVADSPDAFYVYKPADPRVGFTEDLGLTTAPSVEALASGEESFFYTLSRERLDELESDLIVSYAATPEASQAFLSSPAAQLLPAVQRGAVAEVVGEDLVASVSPPTALSLTYGLDEYVEALTAAAAKG
jgi:iron complex transport system substrate-binding protein